MAPKRKKTEVQMQKIDTFFVKGNNGPGSSSSSPGKRPKTASQTPTSTPLRMKEENGGDCLVPHLHRFTVKLDPSHRKAYTIDCDQPRTVLEAIRPVLERSKKTRKPSEKKIIIQMGRKDRASIVANHFPCSCVPDGESLIISFTSEKVEVLGKRNEIVHPKDGYVVFYIDTVGGINTKTKDLFRSKMVKQYKYLCVYGEKGMTVEDVLKRDGRFVDDLGDFTLSDNENPDHFTLRTQRVDNLHQKKFKICLPKNKREKVEQPTRSILDVACESGISVKKAMEQPGSGVDHNEIYERLRQMFPDLKEWMESRFPDGSYKKALDLRKENFGKIQQAFSEVYRLKKLLEMGKSVCKVIVTNVCQGTGFVLFENFILTNAHLLKDCLEGRKLKEHIDVFALFNFDDPEPNTNYFYFTAEKLLLDIDDELDYAILELKPKGRKSNQQTRAGNINVPPGLLKKFGPKPENGEACIIGQPAGGVKKIDPICIIEPEKREQAVNDHLARYHNMFVLQSITQQIKDQGIENIMMGGDKADKVSTYSTFMYHGASGSPVFDAHCRLFGLHTAGYTYGFPEMIDSVLEYAQPLLTIFEKFVCNMKERGEDEMLERVAAAVAENQKLREILKVEPMEAE